MYMSYSKNPYLPKLRMEAVKLVRLGTSILAVARHIGVEPSTVNRWIKIAPTDLRMVIQTKSNRPNHHPSELSVELVKKYLSTGQCTNEENSFCNICLNGMVMQ